MSKEATGVGFRVSENKKMGHWSNGRMQEASNTIGGESRLAGSFNPESVPGRWRGIVRGTRSSGSPVFRDLISLCVHALHICNVITPLSLVVGSRRIPGTCGAPQK
ncbi:MAG: hypothetical protein JSV13_08985, partial [Nitrospiraceae bacterium]